MIRPNKNQHNQGAGQCVHIKGHAQVANPILVVGEMVDSGCQTPLTSRETLPPLSGAMRRLGTLSPDSPQSRRHPPVRPPKQVCWAPTFTAHDIVIPHQQEGGGEGGPRILTYGDRWQTYWPNSSLPPTP